jgi:hypothetical protein
MPVFVDIDQAIAEAIDGEMHARGIKDTPENRIDLLKRMHEDLASDDKTFAHNPIQKNDFLLGIENEVKRLEAEND